MLGRSGVVAFSAGLRVPKTGLVMFGRTLGRTCLSLQRLQSNGSLRTTSEKARHRYQLGAISCSESPMSSAETRSDTIFSSKTFQNAKSVRDFLHVLQSSASSRPDANAVAHSVGKRKGERAEISMPRDG